MSSMLFLMVVTTSLALSSAPTQDRWLDIHCGQLLDVERKETLVDQHVLVHNDVIAEIGRRVDAPTGVERIDLSEQTCMPGLMDMHVHLFVDATEDKPAEYMYTTQSSAYNTLLGLRHAQILLNQGFTTIRIPGDLDYQFAAIELRDAFERGDFTGPRMLVAPHWFGATSGAGDAYTYAPDLPFEVTFPIVVDGVDAIRKAVREEIKYGADWIKFYATGSVMGQKDDPSVVGYSVEEMKAYVDEAHRHKKKVTAHAHGDAGGRLAVEAGVDCIEHGTMFEEATIKLMAEKGTWYVPTTYFSDWIRDAGQHGAVSDANMAKARLVARTHSNVIKMAYRHGVRMALGSDPIFPMDQAVREFNAMVKRIPDHWYVLRMGTIGAAEMLGLENEIGSLAVSKQADIVASPASPIDDMENIEQVRFVMKGGRVIRHDSD